MRQIRKIALAFILLIGTIEPSQADGVLVFGGTGRLGAQIVKQLANAGEDEITVFARSSSDRNRLEGLPVEFVVGDVLNESDVETALKTNRFDVVINALSNPRSNNNDTFFENSQASITKWAKATNVQRLIFHSSIGVGDSAGILREDIPASTVRRFRDKEVAETSIIESGIEYAILRNYIIQPEGTPASGKGFLTEDRSVAGSIARTDLAILTVYCLDGPICQNKVLHASTRED